MNFHSDQRKFFDNLITEHWDSYISDEWDASRRNEVKELFEIIQPKKVLDIGCGCGFHDKEMAKFPFVEQVDGVDYSTKSIETAEKNYSHPKVRRWSSDFKVLSGQYDAVVSFQVFEHLDEPEAYLEQCKRLLNRGGSIAIITPNFDCLDNRIRDLRKQDRIFVDPLHFTEYNRLTLSEIASRHGLVELGAFGCDLGSQLVPSLNRLPQKLRFFLGSAFPFCARIIGSVFRCDIQ